MGHDHSNVSSGNQSISVVMRDGALPWTEPAALGDLSVPATWRVTKAERSLFGMAPATPHPRLDLDQPLLSPKRCGAS